MSESHSSTCVPRDNLTNGQVALALHDAGYWVVPLCWPIDDGERCGSPWKTRPGETHDHSKDPKQIGKTPLVPWAAERLTRKKLEDTFRRAPRANVGIILEKSRLIHVDPDSQAAFDEVYQLGAPSSVIRQSRNPSLLYRAPEDCALARAIHKGATGAIDVLSKGIAIVHGEHRTGAAIFLDVLDLAEMELADAPDWAVDLLKTASEHTPPAPAAKDGDDPPVRLVGPALDTWRGVRVKLGGTIVKRGEHTDVDRSDTLFLIGQVLAQAGASRRTIVDALAERDLTLGFAKYSERRDDGEAEYERIADKVLDEARLAKTVPAPTPTLNGTSANGTTAPGSQAPPGVSREDALAQLGELVAGIPADPDPATIDATIAEATPLLRAVGPGAREAVGKQLARKLGITFGAVREAVSQGNGSDPGNADVDDSPGGDDDEKKSQADMLVDLARQGELFHDATGDTYARLAVGDHHEVWPTRSKGFRRWLVRAHYTTAGDAPRPESVAMALSLIDAIAQFDGECRAVYVRVAPDGADGLFVDLGDRDWRAVHVTESGWDILTDPPVMFRRSPGLGALFEPTRGGRLDDLREFVNVPDDGDWALIRAWLVAALADHGPIPVLALKGEQGSAKSTLARCLRALVDPATPSLRRPPRDERDLAIAARSCWIIGYDNVSDIRPWLSDGLCSLVTGGGFATRELYTDFDEALFAARRPVLLNGIEDYVARGDLADRVVDVTMPPIPEDQRRDEKTLLAAFDAAAPAIFGALLDSLAGALRMLPMVHLDRLPRMADFARVAVAAEQARGEAPAFLVAYATARKNAEAATIEGSVIGPALLILCDSLPWEGTAGELLGKLSELVDEKATKMKTWPQNARAVSGELRRLAPALRRSEINVIFGTRTTGGRRPITIDKAPPRPSLLSRLSLSAPGLVKPSDGRVTQSDGRSDRPSLDRHSLSPHPDAKSDGPDGSDGPVPTFAPDDTAKWGEL
ncbi:MAG TPA: bifunctional DNA primase/polymerase [Chloroflexota bacterium]|nr:bifunctional DNA primase/polymerase [Chloroflexota bacterium]